MVKKQVPGTEETRCPNCRVVVMKAESHGGRPIVLDADTDVSWYIGRPNGSKEDKWVARPIHGHREHKCRTSK